MPQSKWERGFWASVRGSGSFTPYPPDHWKKPKKKRKKSVNYKKTNKLKTLYRLAYPTDDLGEKINENATIEKVFKTPWRIYDIIGVGDSLVRERVFDIVSRRKKVTYNSIYNAWLDKAWKKAPVKKADIVIGKKRRKKPVERKQSKNGVQLGFLF